MNSMRYAMEKAANENPDLKAKLVQADKNIAERHRVEKEAAHKRAILEKNEKVNKNRQKKIFAWRTSVHGMHYSMRAGIIFADDRQDAENIIKSKLPTDTISYLEEIPYEEDLIEIGMYIE